MNLIKQLSSEGKTIVLITHDNEIAMEAEKTIIIKDGMLVNGNIA